MEHTMSDLRSRYGILVGLTAAAGAFGAAAMVSAATAPTARADLYDDTVSAIDYNLAEGQTAFGVAASDFGSSNVPGGLTTLLDAVDDDSLLAPQNAYIGLVDALTNEPFSGDPSYYVLTQPTDFAQAETLAQSSFTYGEGQFADAASYFAAGDYGDAAYFDTTGVDATFFEPLEYLLLGAAASF
jgi:hypothetical protein